MIKPLLRWLVPLCLGFCALVVRAQESTVLTLTQARELSIKNHPRITAAELIALASHEIVREARSAYYPSVTANATAVGTAASNTRIAAGGLNNPLILERNAEGVTVSQLITDFGRTHNLTASSKSQEQAQEQNALATRAQILLALDSAYFSTLQAQSLLSVATQTVATRQLTFEQVNQLAQNKLKSTLDVSFARVNLQEAMLLQAQATNDLEAAFAGLINLLGERNPPNYHLVDEPLPTAPSSDAAQLVQEALRNRPDLVQSRYQVEAARSLARAERDLHYPTISAVGTAGIVPIGDSQLRDNYAAAGVNFSLPIFEGFLYSAKQKEAQFRARAAAEDLRDAENNVIRDVKIASMNLDYAAARLDLTAKLLESANEALDLAKTRYQVGSSSIVELSQAELSQTEAQIAQARARYEYQTRSSILNYEIGELR